MYEKCFLKRTTSLVIKKDKLKSLGDSIFLKQELPRLIKQMTEDADENSEKGDVYPLLEEGQTGRATM